MPMTKAEGAVTDRLARGEQVKGGPGACNRAGCYHAKVWHSGGRSGDHACEKCRCPRFVPQPEQQRLRW